MNQCSDHHHPMYKIKYKATNLGGIMSEWLVCERCFGKQEFFGQSEEIQSIVSLRNHSEIRLEIVHLTIMTKSVTKKLKNTLLIN